MGIFGTDISGEDILGGLVTLGTEFIRTRAPAPVILQPAGPPMAFPAPTAAPSFAGRFDPTLVDPRMFQQAMGPPLIPEIEERALQLLGPGVADAGACPPLFKPAVQRATPVRRIMQRNPMNPERIEVWEHAGTPVLFSRDIRCAKRVQKLARRARGRRGG